MFQYTSLARDKKWQPGPYPGVELLVLHKSEETGGLTVLRKFHAGTTVPAHIHPQANESAYVLSGEWEESFLRGSFGRGAIEEHIRVVLEDLRALRLPADESLLARWTSYDIQPRLGAIDARALVIAAKDDVILSPRHGATWARALRRARLVEIAGAGHYVQLEEARAVAEYVRAFVVTETAKGVERP